MKRAVLANGIPASGKSYVARALSVRCGWPLLTLDSIKEPFFDHLGIGDREFNRKLGRASYQAIWSIVGDAPPGMTFIVDAWFGFQPVEVLEAHLARAGITQTAEIWCHAPTEVIVQRYRERLPDRHPGHPGEDLIPDLIALSQRAKPLNRGPVFDADTTRPVDIEALERWLRHEFEGAVSPR